jgi:hypothetical protein
MVHAATTKPLDDVTVMTRDAVTAAGYRPAGMDNEGFEAEVFFTSRSSAAGQALVRGTADKATRVAAIATSSCSTGTPSPRARSSRPRLTNPRPLPRKALSRLFPAPTACARRGRQTCTAGDRRRRY